MSKRTTFMLWECAKKDGKLNSTEVPKSYISFHKSFKDAYEEMLTKVDGCISIFEFVDEFSSYIHYNVICPSDDKNKHFVTRQFCITSNVIEVSDDPNPQYIFDYKYPKDNKSNVEVSNT